MSREKNNSKRIHLMIGPLLLVLCLLLLPGSTFTFQSKGAVGTVLWMSYWWITMPVNPAITAFLPILVNAFINAAPMESITKNYASEIVLLLAGANLISIAWEETGVDKRMALSFLNLIGPSVKQQIAVWLLASSVLSAVLPNSVVVAVLTPIAVSMLKFIGEGDIANSDVSSLILLAIVWGANNGGMASPLGGAMNLISIEYIESYTGTEFLYMDWVVKMAPFTLAITTLTLVYLLSIKTSKKNLNGSKEYFQKILRELPKINRDEIISLVLFLAATVLAFTRQFYQSVLPGLKPAYVFLVCGFLTFLINKKDGKKLLEWKVAEQKIIWDLIFLFAGGMALGSLVNDSGTAQILADFIASMNLTGGFLTIFVLVAFIVILSDVINNTSAAAVAIPIVIGIATGMKLPVIPYVFIASVAYNVSYTLPTSIRAVPIGYGLNPRFMFRKGLLLSALVIVSISVVGYVLLLYWPTFGA